VLRKKGSIIIAGGGPHKGPIDDAFTLRAGKRVGIITTASGHAGTKKTKEDIPYYWMTPPEGVEVDLLHPTDPRDVDDPSFADCIDDWTAAWVPGGAQKRLEIFRNTLVLEKLRKLWERGGVIGGTSAGAAVMGDIMIRQGYPEPELCEGFGFVPNAVFDQHVDTRNRMERLLRTLRKHPMHTGVGIAEETAVVLDGDEDAEVIGKGTVNFHAPNSDMPIIFYPGDIFNLRTGMVRRKSDRTSVQESVGAP
jgi:cyanophycinase